MILQYSHTFSDPTVGCTSDVCTDGTVKRCCGIKDSVRERHARLHLELYQWRYWCRVDEHDRARDRTGDRVLQCVPFGSPLLLSCTLNHPEPDTSCSGDLRTGHGSNGRY